jgi:hypothetical protein
MTDLKSLRPAMPILLGVAMMLSLSMGLRQSFGLIMQPLTRDLAITVSDFTLAMAMQNLAWGFLQPVAGALAVQLGFARSCSRAQPSMSLDCWCWPTRMGLLASCSVQEYSSESLWRVRPPAWRWRLAHVRFPLQFAAPCWA